jgi:CheY-like chemotaxis protein
MPQKKRILVVDDEQPIASTLSIILNGKGYETATAFSGEEAVLVASSFQPDCLLSDIAMGEMNGIDAAVEILRSLPLCKVLFVSGHASYQDFTRAKGFECLCKPVHPPALLARLEQVLSN